MGGILEFVGVTTIMRGHIAPSSPNWGKPVSICEFKYERVKIFVGLDPLIHILIRKNVFTKTKSNYDQFNLYNIKILRFKRSLLKFEIIQLLIEACQSYLCQI